MKIKNIEGLSMGQLQDEINKGGKFVMYQYCISIIVMTFRRPSEIYFLRHDQSPLKTGLKYSAVSLVLGWWGLPWGPIYTIGSMSKNFAGGKDLTHQVTASLMAHYTPNENAENLLPDFTSISK